MTRKGKIILGISVGIAVITSVILLLASRKRKNGMGGKSLLKSNKT